MFEQSMNFGFKPSNIDGTEHVFGVSPAGNLPKSYSYKKFLPGVLNQGAESICVPCSISAYLNWKLNLETGEKKDNQIDLHEIYNARTNYTDGMTFKEAFYYLRHKGVKYDSGRIKIMEYAILKNAVAIKTAIIMNGPCIGALPVYNDSREFWNDDGSGNFYGYHAVAIVGYNSEGFIIRNSWGKGFADNGYTVLRYSDYDKFIEIWTIID